MDGFTQQQRFFMNYANIWKCKTRREEVLKRLTTDPHSPPCFRVNGILINLPEFYETFNISDNSKMFLKKEDRTVIW